MDKILKLGFVFVLGYILGTKKRKIEIMHKSNIGSGFASGKSSNLNE